MTIYAAFLRGINVGGRVVRMADLKICLEKAGLDNVTTLLQSGNVVFDSALQASELKRVIEATLTDTFSYPAKVQVLPMTELAEIVGNYPFGAAGGTQHDYVVFMEDGLEAELLKEPYELAPGEQVQAGQGVIYWRVGKGSTLKSDLSKLLVKAKYKNFNTNRNINTLRKIITKI